MYDVIIRTMVAVLERAPVLTLTLNLVVAQYGGFHESDFHLSNVAFHRIGRWYNATSPLF